MEYEYWLVALYNDVNSCSLLFLHHLFARHGNTQANQPSQSHGSSPGHSHPYHAVLLQPLGHNGLQLLGLSVAWLNLEQGSDILESNGILFQLGVANGKVVKVISLV